MERRTLSRQGSEKTKKEEFPGVMENMPPGNSFPQICVVSVNKYVEIAGKTQEYLGSAHLGNT
jgi:hypothetical protein